MKVTHLFFLSVLLGSFFFQILGMDASTKKDMPFVTTAKFCLECHSEEQSVTFRTRTTKSCSTYCKTCHKDLGAHHKTEMRLKGKDTRKVNLLNGKVACFSCHDLSSKRYDSSSWKAQSLYESLFKGKKVYPTYFLIEKNSEGQLCKRCH